MIKKNNNVLKKSIPKTLFKCIQLKDKLNLCNNIGRNAIRKRYEHLSKSKISTEIKLKQIEDDLKQFQEVVLWYHKDFIEGHHGKEEAFRHVIQMPYSNRTNRLEFLKKELDKIECNKLIKNNQVSENIKSLQKFSEDKNLSHSATSTSASPLKMKNVYPIFDKISISQSPNNGNTSLNKSSCSSFAYKNSRINEWHKLEPKTITNKICNDCFKKESPISKINNKLLYRCMRCGMYIHESCRDSLNYKLCIPLNKLIMRATGQRNLDLKELCQSQTNPMIPSILLVLMHHIQTFCSKATDIYRVTGREKDVRELCDKLFEGKAKALSRFDVETVGNCLRYILRSLKKPLLLDSVLMQLINCIGEEKIHFENIFADCLRDMSRENQDTLTYLIVHLKIMATKTSCKLDYQGFATVFLPSLVSDILYGKYLKQLIEVLNMVLEIDYEFYDSFICENIFFNNVFNLNMGSNYIN